jgi:acyl-CoA synthetase (AMP-forming)/AMP-acid ligase II
VYKRENHLADAFLDYENEAVIAFTSGATGAPKGVVNTLGNLAAQMQSIRDTLCLQPGEVDLPANPVFALIDLLLGNTVVIPDMRFPSPKNIDPARIINAIQRFGVRASFASPAALERIETYCRANRVKLSGLKLLITAGAPAPVRLLRDVTNLLDADARLLGIYGATEAMPMAIVDSQEILNKTASLTASGAGVCIGRPAAGMSIRIVVMSNQALTAADLTPLSCGQIGEICVSGEGVTRAYLGSPAHNHMAKITDQSGKTLHRTGDVGYLDDQGRLWYCGRRAHVVQTEAKTFFPEQVENVINQSVLVHRSALARVTRPGKAPEAVIFIERSKNSLEFTDNKVREKILEILNGNPKTSGISLILFHQNFPVDVNHNSKILRDELSRQALRLLA